MGQPRIRLISKDPMAHDDDDTQSTPGRSKRPRKPAGSAADSSDAEVPAQVKEECLRLYKSVKEMEKKHVLHAQRTPPAPRQPQMAAWNNRCENGSLGRVTPHVGIYQLRCMADTGHSALGELMCLAFNKLPPKKEYPDYYVEIKKPVALDIIKGKITRGVYGSVAEFVADIDLMCSNAQQYNIPDS
ncbi:hypothetical protein IWW51_002527, partial [Coemansia sp. RSA 2702]